MSKKVSALQMALRAKNEEDGQATPAPPAEAPAPTPMAQPAKSLTSTAPYIAPSRAGKTAKTHYLPRSYWDTLEEVSFRTRDDNGKRVPQERLVAEALNLLFVKYNYPQVREDDPTA